MGHRCCSKQKIKRGLWSPEEDEKLMRYINTHGHKSWSSVPKFAGLQRCGKSCRLRWINYLRPDLKRGSFTAEEEQIIIDVHRILGNRWAQIAKHLPGRTDNEVKNFWNSCIKKKLISQGLDPQTHNLLSSHKRRITSSANCTNISNNHIHQNPNSPFTIHISSSQMPNIIAPIIETSHQPNVVQTPSSTIVSTSEYHHRFSDLPYEPPPIENIENCIWGSRVGDKDFRAQTLEEEGTQAEVHPGKGIAIDDEEIREANNYNENVEMMSGSMESSNFDFGLLESVLNSEFMSHDDINYMDELAWYF